MGSLSGNQFIQFKLYPSEFFSCAEIYNIAETLAQQVSRHGRCIGAWISHSPEHCTTQLGIMRKAFCLIGDPVLVLRCFWRLRHPTLDYCSPVWMSTADSHIGLLDRVVLCIRIQVQTSCGCTLHVLQDLLYP